MLALIYTSTQRHYVVAPTRAEARAAAPQDDGPIRHVEAPIEGPEDVLMSGSGGISIRQEALRDPDRVRLLHSQPWTADPPSLPASDK